MHHRVLKYIHASATREFFAFLIFTFILSWGVWFPLLLASPKHEQLGDPLIIGTFGPAVAAIVLSFRRVKRQA